MENSLGKTLDLQLDYRTNTIRNILYCKISAIPNIISIWFAVANRDRHFTISTFKTERNKYQQKTQQQKNLRDQSMGCLNFKWCFIKCQECTCVSIVKLISLAP